MTHETDSDPDLPELDAEEERRLGTLLRSAFAPTEIDAARHERLLQVALEDPFAPASAEEIAQSERLRQALEGEGDHADAVLARALAAAYAPSNAPPQVEPPTRLAPAVVAAEKPAGKLLYFRFVGVAATLAAAAAVLLAVTPRARLESAPELPAFALAQSRSTAPLIQADAAGAPSTRIDRIASLRGRELRDNRYALWGVR